jgi:[ribosomal protein S5]-alanine N-acetyltransferase
MQLHAGTVASLMADLEGHDALAAELRAEVPEAWPPEYYDDAAILWTLDKVQNAPAGDEAWYLYYWVLRNDRHPVLVGVGGYKGPPQDGVVEVGYGVLPEFRRQGLATEGVAALIEHAFASADVREVIAETMPELIASIGVLEKNDFDLIGAGSEEGVIRFSLLRTKWHSEREGL